MRVGNFDGGGAAYCKGPILTAVIPAKTAEPIDRLFGDVDSGGPKVPCVTWGSRSPTRTGNFKWEMAAPL